MWYAKETYGGKLAENGGASPGATVVFSPSIQKAVGKVDTKKNEGKIE